MDAIYLMIIALLATTYGVGVSIRLIFISKKVHDQLYYGFLGILLLLVAYRITFEILALKGN